MRAALTPIMRQVLVRMPPAMYDAIRQRADANDRAISAEIRRAIRRYLESK